LTSFWLIIRQQWAFKEMSIFSKATILNGGWHFRTPFRMGTTKGKIPPKFALILFCCFRVRRTSSNGKNLWPDEFKRKNRNVEGMGMVVERRWRRVIFLWSFLMVSTVYISFESQQNSTTYIYIHVLVMSECFSCQIKYIVKPAHVVTSIK
jgi:hypothetical protein